MPYEIRKTGPPSKPWCVFNTETDENKGCSATKTQAKKHLAVLNMREHGIPPKKKEGEEETSMADSLLEQVLSEPPPDPASITLSPDYLFRLGELTAEVQKVTKAVIEQQQPTSPVPDDITTTVLQEVTKQEDEDEEEEGEYTCECLDCGHTLTSKEHCSDVECPECGGEMRRAERPGPGRKDVEQYVGGIEAVFPGATTIEEKAQSERDKKRAAAQARAKRYGISVKEGGNLTYPKGYPTTDSEYGDPVNYRYPADAAHARAALGYFNHEGQRAAGGYTSSEWAIIGKRLARLISRHLTGSYTYSAGKLQQTEKKDVSLDAVVQQIRDAFYSAFNRRDVPMSADNSPYIHEVFDSYVIARRGGKTYKYPYTETEDGYEFGDPVEVEEEVTFTEKKAAGLLDFISNTVKSIWDKIKGDGEPSPSISSFFVTKAQSDGTYRWVSISSTAFRDRENEIVSMEGVSKSIARADAADHHGPLLFWHEPITLGTCDFQAQSGVCLVESGLWADTPLAGSVRKGMDKNPTRWGKSIGFLPLAFSEDVVIKGATVKKVWTDLQIAERSILPNSEAASLFTQITTRGQPMEKKKKDALVELLGDEALVDEVLAKAEEINAKASEPTAIVKESHEESPPGGEEATQQPYNTEETPPEGDDLMIALKALREQVETLDAEVKALQETQSAPRMAIHRPSISSETSPDDDTETKETPGYPRVVEAMGNKVLGR